MYTWYRKSWYKATRVDKPTFIYSAYVTAVQDTYCNTKLSTSRLMKAG